MTRKMLQSWYSSRSREESVAGERRRASGNRWTKVSPSFLLWNSKVWFCSKRESEISDLTGGIDMKTLFTIVAGLLVLGTLTFTGCNTAPGGRPAPAAAA